MLILALDLARVTGFALGEPGGRPESGSWELGPPDQDVRFNPGVLTRRLTAVVAEQRPDLIAIEDFMAPTASQNQKATIAQLLLHGGLHAWASASRIRVKYESVNSIRKTVCGRASAGSSLETKEMVRQTMVRLGYVPAGCRDTDRTDALAVWRWAEATFGGVRQQLVLTP